MKKFTITIEYKLTNSLDWNEVAFEPEEYFDLETNEEPEWDSVPIFNHAVDYLDDIDKQLVQNTKIVIIDHVFNVNECITETFWNQGENRIIERTTSGSISDWEMIVDIKIPCTPWTSEILRFHKKNNVPVLSYHGFFKDNEDGTEDEQIIYHKSTGKNLE